MKFKKLIPVILFAALLVAYFTKPSKEDFSKFIRSSHAASATPVIDFEDKVVYVNVSAFFVNDVGAINRTGSNAATGVKEEYIGLFKRFWKVKNNSNQ